jgi:hypothetical protein
VKTTARVSDENKLDQFVGDFAFDVHVLSATSKPSAAVAETARRKLISEMRKFDCEILEFYDCHFKKYRCTIFAKAKFKSLDGVKRWLFGETASDRTDAEAVETMDMERVEQPKSHAWTRKKELDHFYDYPANVNARVSSEVRRFPRTITALYGAGMTRDGAEITSASLASELRKAGGKLKKFHGLYIDKSDEDVRPKAHVAAIALVDVELENSRAAHKLFDTGRAWVDPLIDPNNKKMARMAQAWLDDIPREEDELTTLLDDYERCVNIVLKDRLVRPLKPLVKQATARVSSEKSALKPLVIPKFWFMNNSPNGTSPLNAMIKDDVTWLKSKGINSVTPVRAVARTFGGDGMAARYVMAVAYRLDLSPREMINYTDSMVRVDHPIETEDDIAAFWKEQAAKHAKTEKQYMDDKQYPDLKVFDVVKSHGRWTLGHADEAVASVANRHGLQISARVAGEQYPGQSWIKLIDDASIGWPMKIVILKVGHSVDDRQVENWKKFVPDLEVENNAGTTRTKPMTKVSGHVKDAALALRFALARIGENDIPLPDGSSDARWFAHRLIEILGRQNFDVNSTLVEYSQLKGDDANKASPGLMSRLRKLIGL